MFLTSIIVFLSIVFLLFLAQIGPIKRRKKTEAELRDNVVTLKATYSSIRSRRHEKRE